MIGILVVISVNTKKAALLTEECEEIIDNKTWLIKKHIKTVSIKKTFQ